MQEQPSNKQRIMLGDHVWLKERTLNKLTFITTFCLSLQDAPLKQKQRTSQPTARTINHNSYKPRTIPWKDGRVLSLVKSGTFDRNPTVKLPPTNSILNPFSPPCPPTCRRPHTLVLLLQPQQYIQKAGPLLRPKNQAILQSFSNPGVAASSETSGSLKLPLPMFTTMRSTGTSASL